MEELIETSKLISLCDVLTTLRLKTPVYSSLCTHPLKCIELENYHSLIERAKTLENSPERDRIVGSIKPHCPYCDVDMTLSEPIRSWAMEEILALVPEGVNVAYINGDAVYSAPNDLEKGLTPLLVLKEKGPEDKTLTFLRMGDTRHKRQKPKAAPLNPPGFTVLCSSGAPTSKKSTPTPTAYNNNLKRSLVSDYAEISKRYKNRKEQEGRSYYFPDKGEALVDFWKKTMESFHATFKMQESDTL